MPKNIQRAALLDDSRSECYLINKTLAGYVHLHWGRNPETARYFVQEMQKAKKRL
jgi:cobyrinic acid a,c-diamide synthase